MAKTTSAGSKVSIGTTASGFLTDAFSLIGEITDIGEFGKSYSEIKHNPIGDRKTYKFKGSYDNGQMQLKLARDLADAGQAAALAALDSDSDYNFRIELNDAITANTGHGTRLDFKAKVMGFTINIQNVNSVVGGTITLGVDGDITVTEPT